MKRISLLTLLLWVSFPLWAIHFGVEGGLDLNKFHLNKDLLNSDNRMGWFAGLKIKQGLPLPNLGFDAAVLYKEGSLDYEEHYLQQNKTLRTLVVPVNLRYDWKIVNAFRIYLATGPQFNWNLQDNDIGSVGKLDATYFDWNLGAGIELTSHVQIGFTYNIPLGKMGEVNSINLESKTWSIRVGVFL